MTWIVQVSWPGDTKYLRNADEYYDLDHDANNAHVFHDRNDLKEAVSGSKNYWISRFFECDVKAVKLRAKRS